MFYGVLVRLIFVKHTGMFANMKVLSVLVAVYIYRENKKEEKKFYFLPTNAIIPRSVVGKEMKGF